MSDRDDPELVDVFDPAAPDWARQAPADGRASGVRLYGGRPWWPWLVTAAAALTVAGLVHSRRPALPQAVVAHPSVAASSPPDHVVPSRRVIDVHRRLLGISAGWNLFARGAGSVVRVQFAQGRVTITRVPPEISNGPSSFLAVTDGVIVRPVDDVSGYLIPDTGPAAVRLTGALRAPGAVFPGPGPGQLWVDTTVEPSTRRIMTLIGADGAPTGVTLGIPNGAELDADGRGYLIYTDLAGHTYDATAAGRRSVPGQLLAVGPTRWLTRVCSRGHRCEIWATDSGSGARRMVTHADIRRDPLLQPGLGFISPDGRTAALPRSGSPGIATITFISLVDGTQRPFGFLLGESTGYMVWSPDSRLLFATVTGGYLEAIDVHTDTSSPLGVQLPQVTELALRTSPSG